MDDAIGCDCSVKTHFKMAASIGKKSVLFVCLGNICRSPIAEAVFQSLVAERGIADEWIIDSAATGNWHTGSFPDPRAQSCMKRHGIPMNHSARQIVQDDFTKFQYIFGMDSDNIKVTELAYWIRDIKFKNIKRVAPANHPAKIELLGKYDPQNELLIRDPYYDSGDRGFEEVYQHCLRCCDNFLNQISV